MKCACGKACRPLISDHYPKASEWYCEKCHKSHPMSGDDLEQVRMMNGGPPQRGPNDLRGA